MLEPDLDFFSPIWLELDLLHGLLSLLPAFNQFRTCALSYWPVGTEMRFAPDSVSLQVEVLPQTVLAGCKACFSLIEGWVRKGDREWLLRLSFCYLNVYQLPGSSLPDEGLPFSEKSLFVSAEMSWWGGSEKDLKFTPGLFVNTFGESHPRHWNLTLFQISWTYFEDSSAIVGSLISY